MPFGPQIASISSNALRSKSLSARNKITAHTKNSIRAKSHDRDLRVFVALQFRSAVCLCGPGR